MAQLRHIAISVPDPDKAATFYETVFGMTRVGTTDSPLATGVYLSDGVMNIALLAYKTDEMAGTDRGKDFVGLHHFGFKVDNAAETKQLIEESGGEFFMDLPELKDTLYYEEKFRDPNGLIFDISEHGWVTKRA